MKIAPVSADLLIKVALAGVTLAVVAYLVKKATDAATDAATQAAGKVGDALQAINPASENNVIYQTANWATEAVTGKQETFGGWLYDLTHADPLATPR